MRPFRGYTRIFILSLLTLSVFVPIILLSYKLKHLSSNESKEFDVEDLSVIKHRTEVQAFSAIEEGEGQALKELSSGVYKDVKFSSGVSLSSSDETNRIRERVRGNAADDANSFERDLGFNLDPFNQNNRNHELGNEEEEEDANSLERDVQFDSGINLGSDETNSIRKPGNAADDAELLERNGTNDAKKGNTNNKEADLHTQQEKKDKSKPTKAQRDQGLNPQSRRALDEKVNEMIDQIIMAKAYLKFEPPTSKSHLMKELRSRMKEVEHALGDSVTDSELPRRAVQKMKALEASLLKASRMYPDCQAMDKKLRGMTYSAEEQARAHKDQTRFLFQLAGRTTPKGLHCLSMRLTSEYFALQPEERELPNQHKLHDSALYHFAVFSDNILACAVVVNSTVSNAHVITDLKKIVFHIVTDSLNVPAMTMWFLLNPPGEAAVEIQSIDNFGWLSVKYDANLQKQDSLDLRFTSPLNHLRFYLPDIFPRLHKVVLLDHDVVVQRNLIELWEVNMKGKVNGAVTTCQKGEPSFRQMDTFINFDDPIIAKSFDVNACTWAFGMNILDLQEWRMQDLSAVYHKYLQLGTRGSLMKAGSLPIGWLTFYNQTMALDRRWHVLGLGYESGVKLGDIERASVIHFDGMMKPWLEIGLEKYKPYWDKYVNYRHPLLEQCNIHT